MKFQRKNLNMRAPKLTTGQVSVYILIIAYSTENPPRKGDNACCAQTWLAADPRTRKRAVTQNWNYSRVQTPKYREPCMPKACYKLRDKRPQESRSTVPTGHKKTPSSFWQATFPPQAHTPWTLLSSAGKDVWVDPMESRTPWESPLSP